MASREIQIGKIPSRDGSNYDAHAGSPTFRQMLLEANLEEMKEMEIVVVGKLYTGRDSITGATYITDIDSIRRASKESGSYNQRMANMLGMAYTPSHITGVVMRKIR